MGDDLTGRRNSRGRAWPAPGSPLTVQSRNGFAAALDRHFAGHLHAVHLAVVAEKSFLGDLAEQRVLDGALALEEQALFLVEVQAQLGPAGRRGLTPAAARPSILISSSGLSVTPLSLRGSSVADRRRTWTLSRSSSRAASFMTTAEPPVLIQPWLLSRIRARSNFSPRRLDGRLVAELLGPLGEAMVGEGQLGAGVGGALAGPLGGLEAPSRASPPAAAMARSMTARAPVPPRPGPGLRRAATGAGPARQPR